MSYSITTLVNDAAMSQRSKDSQGFLHVSHCHITKAGVRPYMGRELPQWRKLGLEPDRVYNVLCPPEELEKYAHVFNGLHLLLDHAEDTAAAPRKDLRVGNIGTTPVFNNPYLDNDICVTDIDAIVLIEAGERVELSSSYGFTTVVETGVYEGTPFDLKMTNLHGNHVALVEEGRAGEDVRVADRKPPFMENDMDEKALTELIMKILASCGITPQAPAAVSDEDADKLAAEKEAAAAKADEKPVEDEDPAAKEKAQAADDIVNIKIEKEAVEEHPGAPDGQVVMDAALAKAKADIHAAYKASAEAARECRSILGDIDPLVFDSADAIYGKALTQLGYDASKFPASAWRGMVQVARDRQTVETPRIVGDSAVNGQTIEIDDSRLARIRS